MYSILDTIIPIVGNVVVVLLFTIPTIWGLVFSIALSGSIYDVLTEILANFKRKQKAKDIIKSQQEESPYGIVVKFLSLVGAAFPLLLIGTIFVVFVWPAFEVEEPSENIAIGAESATSAQAEPVVLDGKTLFDANCAVCHQQTGIGVAGVFPPLQGSDWVTGDTSRIVKIVLNGLSGPIVVNNQSYNSVMPGFSSILSSAEIAAIITYERTSWGNEGEAIDAELVDQIKEEIGSRVLAFTVEEL